MHLEVQRRRDEIGKNHKQTKNNLQFPKICYVRSKGNEKGKDLQVMTDTMITFLTQTV